MITPRQLAHCDLLRAERDGFIATITLAKHSAHALVAFNCISEVDPDTVPEVVDLDVDSI